MNIQELRFINSSASEQRNIIIEKIQKSVQQRTLANYMYCVRFMLELDNRCIIRRLSNKKTYMDRSHLFKK